MKSFSEDEIYSISDISGNINEGDVVFLSFKVYDNNGNIIRNDNYGNPYFVDDNGVNINYLDSIPSDGSRFVEQNITFNIDQDDEAILTRIVKYYPWLETGTNQITTKTVENDVIDKYLKNSIKINLDSIDSYVAILKEQENLNLPKTNLNLVYELPGYSINNEIQRLIYINERKNKYFTNQESLIQSVRNYGGEIISRFWLVNAVAFKISNQNIFDIENHPDVKTIERVKKVIFTTDTDMKTVRNITQTEYFRRLRWVNELNQFTFFRGMRGTQRNIATNRVFVSVIDNGYFNSNHYAFNDTSVHNSPSDRIISRYDCTNNIDQYGNHFCIEGSLEIPFMFEQHMQCVVGIIASDLTGGQDPNYSDVNDRLKRTGLAPEAHLSLMSIAGELDAIAAMETIVESEHVDIVSGSFIVHDDSNSYCGLTPDYCPTTLEAKGQDLTSLSVNQLYNDGIGFFSAVGNFGVECSCDSQTMSPSNSAGAFAVGAYDGSDDSNSDIYFAFHGMRFNYSAAGPTLDERIKPDITAPSGSFQPKYGLIYLPIKSADGGALAYNGPGSGFNGTSAATPVVSGAAAVLLDYYVSKFGLTWASDPGKLYVSLLNFGDRMYKIGEETAGHLSKYYGSGRLRSRLPTTEGLDYPYRFEIGTINLGLNQSIWINIGDGQEGTNQIPTTVDYFKAAFWWHEDFTSSPSDPNKTQVTSYLCRLDGLWYCTGISSNNDQKIIMISDSYNIFNFPSFNTGYRYAIKIKVTNIQVGQQAKIYYNYFWEDLARDDADGPCNNMTICDPDGLNGHKYLFYR